MLAFVGAGPRGECWPCRQVGGQRAAICEVTDSGRLRCRRRGPRGGPARQRARRRVTRLRPEPGPARDADIPGAAARAGAAPPGEDAGRATRRPNLLRAGGRRAVRLHRRLRTVRRTEAPDAAVLCGGRRHSGVHRRATAAGSQGTPIAAPWRRCSMPAQCLHRRRAVGLTKCMNFGTRRSAHRVASYARGRGLRRGAARSAASSAATSAL